MYHKWYDHIMANMKRLPARFYEQTNGNVPV